MARMPKSVRDLLDDFSEVLSRGNCERGLIGVVNRMAVKTLFNKQQGPDVGFKETFLLDPLLGRGCFNVADSGRSRDASCSLGWYDERLLLALG
jgi:hypothetical protein